TGTETSLLDCYRSGVGVHNCHHFEDVAVRCLIPTPPTTPTPTTPTTPTTPAQTTTLQGTSPGTISLGVAAIAGGSVLAVGAALGGCWVHGAWQGKRGCELFRHPLDLVCGLASSCARWRQAVPTADPEATEAHEMQRMDNTLPRVKHNIHGAGGSESEPPPSTRDGYQPVTQLVDELESMEGGCYGSAGTLVKYNPQDLSGRALVNISQGNTHVSMALTDNQLLRFLERRELLNPGGENQESGSLPAIELETEEPD
nr:scavenger receptor cysteine-rich domain-containing protein [Endozoicomonas sp.]